MIQDLTYHKATFKDLKAIIDLLLEDELGKTRENASQNLDQKYINAFNQINTDLNQYLMIVKYKDEIVSTCHLTLMPSLTFTGATRLQIEAVRVAQKYRGKKIGEWMIEKAIDYGRSNSASIIQLTTNKKRTRAKEFYEKLGFEASHFGMKLYIK